MAKDPRWQEIANLEDVIAVIEAISECSQFIRAHSLRFNPINPVENLYGIKREVDTQKLLIEKLRCYLIKERNGIEQDIKPMEAE